MIAKNRQMNHDGTISKNAATKENKMEDSEHLAKANYHYAMYYIKECLEQMKINIALSKDKEAILRRCEWIAQELMSAAADFAELAQEEVKNA